MENELHKAETAQLLGEASEQTKSVQEQLHREQSETQHTKYRRRIRRSVDMDKKLGSREKLRLPGFVVSLSTFTKKIQNAKQ